MTTASPTPFALPSFGNGRVPRQRQPSRNHHARPPQRRHSPLSALSHPDGFSADAPALQRFSIGDSSDDEIPKPMNFSALTKALLEDRPAARGQSPPRSLKDAESHCQSKGPSGGNAPARESRAGTLSGGRLRIARRSPPQDAARRESPPRVVHLSGSRNSNGLRRTASTIEGNAQGRTRQDVPKEYVTPAPAPRSRSVLGSRANSEMSVDGLQIQSGSEGHRSGTSSNKQSQVSSAGDGSAAENALPDEHDGSVQARSRSAQDGNPNSMRVKRVPIGSGTFLRGAPVRRGVRMRQSEEEHSHLDDGMAGPRAESDRPLDGERLQESGRVNANPVEDLVGIQDFAGHSERPGSGANLADSMDKRRPALYRSTSHQDAGVLRQKPHSPDHVRQSSRQETSSSAPSQAQPVFRIPAPPPAISDHDQENEPPPTFKRNKPQSSAMLGESNKFGSYGEDKHEKGPVASDAPRQALAPLSQNTPLRPAPPPPKMSVVDTATAKAGASTVKKKRGRHAVVNGKMFSIRGCKPLGRGGSSIVWRVMAENDNVFALKKVNLEDCNEETVRGYKAEIELLKRLENVDRVVRLFDWEVNEQKQSLSIVSMVFLL